MISKTGKYGIRAMLALSRLPVEEYAGVARIAELAHVPASYLSKLMQSLGRAGLVESQRGVGGGFRLARPAAEISLYDIVDSLEPLERWTGCFLGNSSCSEEQACAVHHRWKSVQQAYLMMLQQSSLAEMSHHRAHPFAALQTLRN